MTGPESRVTLPESRVTLPESRVTLPESRVTLPESRVTLPESAMRLLRTHCPPQRVAVETAPAPGSPPVLLAHEPLGADLLPVIARQLPRVRVAASVPPEEAAAVLWVFDGADLAGEPEWAELRATAARVDVVHLAASGVGRHRNGRRVLAAYRSRVATEVPRLAGRPIHPLAAGTRALHAVSAEISAELLARPVEAHLRRNALRRADSALDELAREVARRQVAEAGRASAEREQARRDRDALCARRRLAAQSARPRLRADLARARLVIRGETAVAVARLREDARRHLDDADAAGRETVPELFAEALTELSGRLAARLAVLIESVSTDLLSELAIPPALHGSGHGPEPPAATGPVPGTERPVAAPSRPPLEDRLMLLAGASGGIGLSRLVIAPALNLPPAVALAALPLAVATGVGVAWWLTRCRRAAAERARLGRWVTETLAAAVADADNLVADRLLEAEQRLGELTDRVVTERVDELDGALRAHDRRARRRAEEQAERLRADRPLLTEIDAARREIAALLEEPS